MTLFLLTIQEDGKKGKKDKKGKKGKKDKKDKKDKKGKKGKKGKGGDDEVSTLSLSLWYVCYEANLFFSSWLIITIIWVQHIMEYLFLNAILWSFYIIISWSSRQHVAHHTFGHWLNKYWRRNFTWLLTYYQVVLFPLTHQLHEHT